MTSLDPRVGAPVLVVAASIVLATVLGRYHCTVDSLLGTALGVGDWWVAVGRL